MRPSTEETENSMEENVSNERVASRRLPDSPPVRPPTAVRPRAVGYRGKACTVAVSTYLPPIPEERR